MFQFDMQLLTISIQHLLKLNFNIGGKCYYFVLFSNLFYMSIEIDNQKKKEIYSLGIKVFIIAD